MSMDVKLHLGDCLDVMREMDAGSVDAVVTDVPYGLGARLNGGSWGNVAAWDDLVDLSLLLSFAPVVCIWGGNYYALPTSRGWLIWYKPDSPPSMADVEMAWTNQDKNARMISHAIAATNAERVGHPTQKPLRVMKWSLQQLGIKPGATILDPYMGSGTTGVAAIKMGMNFVGIERDERYFAIAEKRIAEARLQLPLLETA